MPSTERQSARLGVMLTSMTTSSRPRAATSGVPGTSAGSSTMMPAWLSPSPSSSSAQIMPWDSSPRILAFFRVTPFGRLAPTAAKATFCPAATLGAPHTTLNTASAPASTVHSDSLSACGCLTQVSTWPTTTPVRPAKGWRISSTSRPSMVSLSASVCTPPS